MYRSSLINNILLLNALVIVSLDAKVSQVNSRAQNVIAINGKAQFDKVVVESNKPVVVKVSAKWCGACTSAKPVFESLSAESPDIVFASVDIDNNKEIANIYGVASLPTFLYFRNGDLVAKDEGFTSKENLRSAIVANAEADLDKGIALNKDETIAKARSCLASQTQSYVMNAYYAVKDFLVNLANTVTSWFK